MQILLIEDSEADAFRIRGMLSATNEPLGLVHARRLEEGMRRAASEKFDVLLLDLTLPDSFGYDTFLSARQMAPELPIVILSGVDDDAVALRAVGDGAQDYLPKDRLSPFLLGRSVRYAIERRRAAVAYLESQNQYRSLFDSLPIAAYTCDAQGLLTYFNAKAVELWGRTPTLRDPANRYTGAHQLWSADGAALTPDQGWTAQSLRTGKSFIAQELIVERADGQKRTTLSHVSLLRAGDGSVRGVVHLLVDITELRQAEESLRQKQEILQAIFDHIPVMIAYFADGKPQYVNREWERFHQISLAEIPFRDVIAELYPDLAERQKVHDFIEAASGTWVDFRPRLPGGKIGDTSWMVVQLSDGTSVHIGQDISDRKIAERQIRENERFARATVNALTSSIAILDEAGSVLEVNEAWRRSASDSGLVPRSWTGCNYLELCESVTGVDAPFARAAAEGIRAVLLGESAEYCSDYQCGDNWFTMRVTRFPGDGPVRAVVAHEDITQRKRVEALELESKTLHSAIASMDQVLGVVGHELRSPLAGLRAMSEYLTEPEARATPEFNQFLGAIGSEVIRMSDIVDNLLEAARLNSGKARWEWQAFDPERVCQDALDALRPLIDESRVRLCCRVGRGGTEIRGDPGALRRLIINLVTNAHKHTSSGRIEVALRICHSSNGRWLALSVRDTGAGIDPAIVSRLGEAFALNSGVVGANFISGTGLGLAICKGIAAAHGGSIRITSEPGRGTTVVVRMRADLAEPIATPAQKSIGQTEGQSFMGSTI